MMTSMGIQNKCLLVLIVTKYCNGGHLSIKKNPRGIALDIKTEIQMDNEKDVETMQALVMRAREELSGLKVNILGDAHRKGDADQSEEDQVDSVSKYLPRRTTRKKIAKRKKHTVERTSDSPEEHFTSIMKQLAKEILKMKTNDQLRLLEAVAKYDSTDTEIKEANDVVKALKKAAATFKSWPEKFRQDSLNNYIANVNDRLELFHEETNGILSDMNAKYNGDDKDLITKQLENFNDENTLIEEKVTSLMKHILAKPYLRLKQRGKKKMADDMHRLLYRTVLNVKPPEYRFTDRQQRGGAVTAFKSNVDVSQIMDFVKNIFS